MRHDSSGTDWLDNNFKYADRAWLLMVKFTNSTQRSVCVCIHYRQFSNSILAISLFDKSNHSSRAIVHVMLLQGDIIVCLSHLAMGTVWRPAVTDMSRSDDNKLITTGVFALRVIRSTSASF